jgi:hypothetical protein
MQMVVPLSAVVEAHRVQGLRMSATVEMAFRTIGKLTAVRRAANDKFGHARWLCKCACGNETITLCTSLLRGTAKSCGCASSRATIGNRVRTHGHSAGGKTSPEYNAWYGMLQRCNNPNNKAYKYYGARGVAVCDRWLDSFENFLADVGPRPSHRHSLDRELNDKGYSPENCRWATKKQQTRNQRSNVVVQYQGREMTLAEAAEVAGVPYNLLWRRVRSRGQSLESAIEDLKW